MGNCCDRRDSGSVSDRRNRNLDEEEKTVNEEKGKMMLCLVILVVLLGILILVRWINREEESDDTAETAGVEVTDAEKIR